MKASRGVWRGVKLRKEPQAAQAPGVRKSSSTITVMIEI